MGKHEAKGRSTRNPQKVLIVTKHAVLHIGGLITLHTVATVILTKSPIALLFH